MGKPVSISFMAGIIMLVKDTPAANETSFHTQGPIPPDAAHLYVPRHCDDALARLISQREYVALIGPRLSGKEEQTKGEHKGLGHGKTLLRPAHGVTVIWTRARWLPRSRSSPARYE